MPRHTPLPRPSRRARLLLLAGAVVTVAAVLGAVLILRLGDSPVERAEAAPPSPTLSAVPGPGSDPAGPAADPSG